MVAPQDIARLVDEAEPEIRNAFITVVTRITREAQLNRLVEAVRSGNVDEVWSAIDMSSGKFNDVREAWRAAFRAGGEAEAVATLGTAFNMGAVGAAAAMDGKIGPLIRDITDEARDLVRDRVVRGIAEGTNPRSVALDIVGRRRPGTHTRTGGMIGLTRTQESWVQNALAELSGDRATSDYFNRKARDRRFDATARRAIREGRPVPAEMREKMIAAYRSRLLRQRGETIARTEAMAAVNAGRHEAIEQAVEDPDSPVRAEDVRRTWITARDEDVRDTHIAMNGQVRGHNEPFESPSGAQLMYPLDRSLGAPASEIVRCRCQVTIRLSGDG